MFRLALVLCLATAPAAFVPAPSAANPAFFQPRMWFPERPAPATGCTDPATAPGVACPDDG